MTSRGSILRVLPLLAAMALPPAAPLHAQREEPPRTATLDAGAIGLGLTGSLTLIEGLAHATLGVRSGVFLGAPAGLIGLESELAYTHVNALDRVDAGGLISWQHALAGSAAYPYAGIGAGVREEWIGSFRQERFPVGFSVGVRALVAREGAVHVGYDFRRILNDPVGAYSEHQIVVGLMLLFGNEGAPRTP